MTIKRIPKLEPQWFDAEGRGKRLMLVACDMDGRELEEHSYPFATVMANETTEELVLELYMDNVSIQVPLTELENAFRKAKNGVHSERWYEENTFRC